MALQLLGFGNCITCQSAELDGGEPAPALGASGKALVPGCRVYSCSTCRSHTAEHNDIISKARFAPFPNPLFPSYLPFQRRAYAFTPIRRAFRAAAAEPIFFTKCPLH